MKHERILFDIIENEVRRIKAGGRFINTYGLGLLGAETACREVVRVYYNEILESVNFVDSEQNYVSASLVAGGGTSKTDGSPSSALYRFADTISIFVAKHFTRKFIEYLDKICDEMRAIGYTVACGYGDIFVGYGSCYVRVSVMDILYVKSLGLSYDSIPVAEIVSGTELGKLEADVAVLVEKIMKG